MRYIGIGDGHDGAANISGGGNIVNSYAACTGTVNTKTVTTALSVSVGDYVLLHQSRKSPSGAGAGEMVKVEATGSGNFTADRSLANTYVTGAQAVLVPQYTSGTINGTLTGTAWNGTIGGIVVLACNGTLTISGGIIEAGGIGYRGQASSIDGGINIHGYQGEYEAGTGTQDRGALAQAGGGGSSADGGGGGGGGGHVNAGSNGQFAPINYGYGGYGGYGTADLSTALFGGAGGTGGPHSNTGQKYGGGGNGGGLIILFVKTLVTASLWGSGGNNGGAQTRVSGDDATQGSGSGGGGAGGSILVYSQSATLGTNLIVAPGGTAPVAYNATATLTTTGGNGSVGRITIYYDSSISGSTNPTYSGYNVDFDAVLTTTAASSITAVSAASGGNITQLGYNEEWATQYGICWNTAGTPTIADPKTELGPKTSTGSFTSNLTGLIASTTYYIRSYVTTTYGTYYGAQQSFTTLSDTTTSSSTSSSTTSTSSSTSTTTSTSSSTTSTSTSTTSTSSSTTSTSSSTTSTSTSSTTSSSTSTSTTIEYLRMTIEEVK